MTSVIAGTLGEIQFEKLLIMKEHEMKNIKTIFIGNYKGGVGKTTTVMSLADYLISEGKNVYVFDLDPQASLSTNLIKRDMKSGFQLNSKQTLNYMITMIQEYMRHKQISKFDLLEGESFLEDIRNLKSLPGHKNIDILTLKNVGAHAIKLVPTILSLKNERLSDIMNRCEKDPNSLFIIPLLMEYLGITESKIETDTYVLFDCPPASNKIMHSVFLYSDYYLIPTIGDDLSSDGVLHYLSEINDIQSKYSFDSNVGGLLLDSYFGKHPNLIGVIETLYKNSAGQHRTTNSLTAMESALNDNGIRSILSKKEYERMRREGMKHIFDIFVKHEVKLVENLNKRIISTEYTQIFEKVKTLIEEDIA